MNHEIKNMVKFLKDKDPERHIYIEDGDTVFIIILNSYHLEGFCEIVEHIDDEGYEAVWKGNYFCVDIVPFIEYFCEEYFTVDEFIELVGTSD